MATKRSIEMARRGAANVQTIIIAWTDMGGIRLTGRQIRYDGVNYKPETEACERACAVCWTARGTDTDLDKARAYAATLDYAKVAIYVYPTTERDPLARAKRAIVAA